MFIFKLDNKINKDKELDYIKDCEIQYKNGHLFFITYSNEAYFEGLLLLEKENGLIEAIPSEFIVDDLHNIKEHKPLNAKVALEMLDIFLNFNKITFLDLSSIKKIYDLSVEKDLEYRDDKLIRKISDNLIIEYKLYLNDYNLFATGSLVDIENNIVLTDEIFRFECSGTFNHSDLEYLFEIFNSSDLNEYIIN